MGSRQTSVLRVPLVVLGALLLVAGLAATDTTGGAGDVHVTPVVTDGHVFASFAAPGAFTADVQEAVKSGLPITFSFLVELRRPSAMWFDHTLASAALAASVKFDNLTRIYQVSKLTDGRVTWSDHTDTEEEMRRWATQFDRVPLPPSDVLEPNAEYYVRVRVQALPRRSFSLWPWGRDDADGRADFTFIK